MNSAKSASLVTIEVLVAPNSEVIVPFIVSTRNIISGYSSKSPVSSLPVQMYLFGGYTTTYDVQNQLYTLVPLMIGCTLIIVLVIVGVSFGSLLLIIRLAITMFMSLCWTYGLMVLVYQPGPGQRAFQRLTPSLKESTGIYWIIPIMSFSILVGLALDYDIFLMSRAVEFRKL
jgi:uncharacterized membrane protein YdfJ with MMPL/SSD domain